ncbi:MAG: sigma 54-interacting transcriptional regulator [Polyangiaceae bacterium]|nr:sigma 54-interacting transcriptional regulator [Polyangiaceae bacterium]
MPETTHVPNGCRRPVPADPVREERGDEGTTLAEAFECAMRRLEAGFGARRGAVILAGPGKGVLRAEAVFGMAPAALRLRAGSGVAGRVAESGRPVVAPSVWQEPMALAEMSEPAAWRNELLSLVSVPLALGGRCVGVLSVYFDARPGAGFEDHLDALRVAAAALARRLRVPALGAPAVVRASLDRAVFEYANMVGSSAAMRHVYEEIGQVARTTATALILGESGTGKELVAQAIHANSDRATRPFIKVHAAAFPETLFESELFGHERGAFTGAAVRKKGRLDLAQGGTLFLDEIGDLPLATQVKLLRVLQFREYERLGGTETLKADVRLVAATNKNMALAMAQGMFREDLYYRLNVFTITVPPLRGRSADVPALAEYFLQKYAREYRRPVYGFASLAMDRLSHYAWPGNVRECENAVERAVVACEGPLIEERHLPETIRAAEPMSPGASGSLAEAVERLERRMIGDALAGSRGNLARAARSLGTTERVLRYKVDKYGFAVPRSRGAGKNGAPET